MEKFKNEIHPDVKMHYRKQVDNASDEQLRLYLEFAENNDNYFLMNVVENELQRRGIKTIHRK